MKSIDKSQNEEIYYVERRNGKTGILTIGIVDKDDVVIVDPLSRQYLVSINSIEKDGVVGEKRIKLTYEQYMEKVNEAVKNR